MLTSKDHEQSRKILDSLPGCTILFAFMMCSLHYCMFIVMKKIYNSLSHLKSVLPRLETPKLANCKLFEEQGYLFQIFLIHHHHQEQVNSGFQWPVQRQFGKKQNGIKIINSCLNSSYWGFDSAMTDSQLNSVCK